MKSIAAQESVFAAAHTVANHKGVHRYSLLRVWDNDAPRMVYIMLNPSTADALTDDPTIRRCMGFARQLQWQGRGFGGIEVVNLFGFRATDPRELDDAIDPVGEHNDKYIELAVDYAAECRMPVVLAWGAHARHYPHRVKQVARLIHGCLGYRVAVLRQLKDGTPAHPLYLPYSCRLTPYDLGALL